MPKMYSGDKVLETPRPGESEEDFLRRMRYEGEKEGFRGTMLEGCERTPEQQRQDEEDDRKDAAWNMRTFDYHHAVDRRDTYDGHDEWSRRHFSGRTAVKERVPFEMRSLADGRVELYVLEKADEHGRPDECHLVFTGHRNDAVREMMEILKEGHNEYWDPTLKIVPGDDEEEEDGD